MASNPITSWQMGGKQWKQWQTLFSWAPKSLLMMTVAMKLRHLLPGRKIKTNLSIVLKSRDIILPTKVRIVKAMVFLVVMCGCKIWTIKKTEWQRTDAFILWCWRTLLRVPWTAWRSNQSILKEINPEYSLRVMLKLKLQYFGHLMWRTNSLEKTLMLRKIESRRRGDNRGPDGWMASPSQWTEVWANSGRWCRTGKPGVLQSMEWQRVGHDRVTVQQLNIQTVPRVKIRIFYTWEGSKVRHCNIKIIL